MAERMGANGQPIKKKVEVIQEILEENPNAVEETVEDINDDFDDEILSTEEEE